MFKHIYLRHEIHTNKTILFVFLVVCSCFMISLHHWDPFNTNVDTIRDEINRLFNAYYKYNVTFGFQQKSLNI